MSDPVIPPDEPLSILRLDGSIDPDLDPGLPGELVVTMYRHMARSRVIDERLVRLQRQGRIGFHIGPPGEEASVVGAVQALEAEDWVFPAYREYPALLVRDVPLSVYLNNAFGNAHDTARGRQMPDHWTVSDKRLMSISSPVGTQIPQAVGLAWAARLAGRPDVALVFFGEGTSSQGDFHVGTNFAGVYEAPCILLCRNNQWAISVPFERQTRSGSIAVKAAAYGIHGVRVDGNDVIAVYTATRRAAERARRGEGATLIEALTYRVGAHSTSDDPRAYRAEEEVAPWRERDPLVRTARYLEALGLWDERKEAALREETDAELKAAIEAAESVAPPALETLFDDVYAEQPWHLREQLAEAQRG